MAVAAILKKYKNRYTVYLSRGSSDFSIKFGPIDGTLYVHFMYEPQLSDFVRFRCIFLWFPLHGRCEQLGPGFGVFYATQLIGHAAHLLYLYVCLISGCHLPEWTSDLRG